MLVVKDLSLRVGDFELKNIGFEVERGEYFVILGRSGVGKTLLLETVAGLQNPSLGTICLRGVDITREKVRNRRLSIVYADSDLFPHLSVYDNIAFPLRSRGRDNIRETVRTAAAQAGIEDKLDRRPETLSSGEYQRAALARGLASGCDIFLLDEPLASLDAKSKNGLRALLRKINRDGMTIVHVTHDYEEAVSLASKIGIMENGELVHVAPPEEIFQRPKSEFIAHFVGVKNYLKGTVKTISNSDLREFVSRCTRILCLTDIPDGEAYLMIQPDEISLSTTLDVASSCRNRFRGRITDIAPARLGLEVTVDVGIELVAMISSDALQSLGLEIGREVWACFKASSCRIYQ